MKTPVPTRRPLRPRVGVLTAAGAALLASLPAARSQAPAPRPAEIVEDNPTPATPPRAQIVPEQPATPPRAEIIPEGEDPSPAPGAPPAVPPGSKVPAAPKAKPAAPVPAPKAKTAEDDLFDYCEMLFAKGDYPLALRQYGEYQRLYPTGRYREEARFKIAESYYLQKNWSVAVVELDNFIRDFPSSRNRARVLFQAGETHRTLASKPGTFPEDHSAHMSTADSAYREVLKTTKSGPFAAYAAFRLASFAYNAAAQNPAQYATAIRYFTIAAAQAPKEQPGIRFASLYFKGQSCKFSNSPKEAAASFEEVILTRDNNEYFEKALTALAEMDVEAGREGAAMKKFAILATEAKMADTRADSMVNAGMIQAKAGKTDEAISYFEDALKVAGASSSLSRARYGLVFAYYKQKEYPKVVDVWRGMSVDYGQLEDARRAQLLLIVGSSYSALNQHTRAIEVYQILESTLPASPEAQEAGYKRLVGLFKLNDPRVTDEVKNYIERWRELKPESEFLDKAWIVRASYYFNRGIWEPAAEAYGKVREKNLEPERLATYLFQRGFAEASHGDREAISTLTDFASKYPDDERLPSALLQRGLTELKFEDLSGALKDFETVRDKYPKSDSAEAAAYHVAKVKGMKQDFTGMVADFRKLLSDYPDSKATAEANYWIGWGLFRLQKFADCLEPLRSARKLDLKAHYTDATLMIISATAQLAVNSQQEIDPLMVEVDSYLKGLQEQKIDPAILRWLGMAVFRDRHDYGAAARYLALVVNRDDPRGTPAEIWSALGESYLESRNPALALEPLDHQLASDAPVLAKARAHLLKARAFFALNRLEEATKSAEEGLSIDKESLVSAQLRLVLGDVAMASRRFNEALSSYFLVMGNWEDATITPLAMEKYIAACQASGDAGNRAKAEATKLELKKRFPRYQQTVTTTVKNQ